MKDLFHLLHPGKFQSLSDHLILLDISALFPESKVSLVSLPGWTRGLSVWSLNRGLQLTPVKP